MDENTSQDSGFSDNDSDESEFYSDETNGDHDGESNEESDEESNQENSEKTSGEKDRRSSKSKSQKLDDELSEADLDRKVKVKIDGQVHTMTVKELTRLQSLEQTSQRRLQEGAKMRQEALEFAEIMKSQDPTKLAKKLGWPEDKLSEWAEEYLGNKYKKSLMSPEELELQKYREEKTTKDQRDNETRGEILKELKDLVGHVPEAVKNLPPEQLHKILEQQRSEVGEAQNRLQKDMVDAWESSGLPKDPYFGQMMAVEMLRHSKINKQDLSAKDAAVKVKEKFFGHVRGIVSKMDSKSIHELLGSDVTTKLRQFNVERVTGKPASFNGKSDSPARRAASQKPMNEHEYRDYMSKLKGTLR